jgi:hypothetical protein
MVSPCADICALCASVALALAVGLCSARADDVEGVKEKLFAAKKE